MNLPPGEKEGLSPQGPGEARHPSSLSPPSLAQSPQSVRVHVDAVKAHLSRSTPCSEADQKERLFPDSFTSISFYCDKKPMLLTRCRCDVLSDVRIQ